MLLGIRRGESLEQDKIILRRQTEKRTIFHHAGSRSPIYSPIINYTVEDVWNTQTFNIVPKSLDADPLLTLYRETSGESSIIRDPKEVPYGKGRFGYWTCTVVRKDHPVMNVIQKRSYSINSIT